MKCGRVRIYRKGKLPNGNVRWICSFSHQPSTPGGISWNVWKYRKHKGTTCERCGFVPEDPCQLDVHHRDNNHTNHDPANLATVCANCHRIIHHIERNTKKVSPKKNITLEDLLSGAVTVEGATVALVLLPDSIGVPDDEDFAEDEEVDEDEDGEEEEEDGEDEEDEESDEDDEWTEEAIDELEFKELKALAVEWEIDPTGKKSAGLKKALKEALAAESEEEEDEESEDGDDEWEDDDWEEGEEEEEEEEEPAPRKKAAGSKKTAAKKTAAKKAPASKKAASSKKAPAKKAAASKRAAKATKSTKKTAKRR